MCDDQAGTGVGAVTLEDVIAQIGDRWDCREITGGFVAVPRGGDPDSAIPKAELSPARLLAVIRRLEDRP